MKKEALRVVGMVPVAPTTLYFAWLDSAQHSAMTTGQAKIDPTVGAKFSKLGGYVTGKLLILDLGRRLVMSWRTADYPREAPDSRVEIFLEALGASTRVTVLHTEIPEGHSEKQKATWNEKYFGPMRAYFSKYLPDPRNPPVRRPPPPPPEDDEDEEEEKPFPKGKNRQSVKPPPPPPVPGKKTPPAPVPAPRPSKPAKGPSVANAKTPVKASEPPPPKSKKAEKVAKKAKPEKAKPEKADKKKKKADKKAKPDKKAGKPGKKKDKPAKSAKGDKGSKKKSDKKKKR